MYNLLFTNCTDKTDLSTENNTKLMEKWKERLKGEIK